MKAAFVGITKTSMSVAYTIKTLSKSNSQCPITVSGVLGSDTDATVNAAIALNVKAYLRFEDMAKDADIIFFATSDNTMFNLIDKIKKDRIQYKTLCHFSSKYSSDVLCCGTTNTYASICIPYMETRIKICDLSGSIVLVEGGGRNFEAFANALQECGECFRICSKDEKQTALMATRFVLEYADYIKDYCEKLYKISGAYDPQKFSKFFVNSLFPEESRQKIKKRNITTESIRADIKLLNSIGIDEFKELYKPLEKISVTKSSVSPDEAEKLKETIRKLR